MTGVGSLDGYIELICPVRNLETEGFVDELEDGPPGLITGKVEAVYQKLERQYDGHKTSDNVDCPLPNTNSFRTNFTAWIRSGLFSRS